MCLLGVSLCGALGRVTRVFWCSVNLCVFGRLLVDSCDNFYLFVLDIVRRYSWYVDHVHSQPPHRRPPPRGALSVARTSIFSGENNARTGPNVSTPTSLTHVASGDRSTNCWVEVGCHLQTLTPRTCAVTSTTKSPESAPLLLVQTHHHSLTARPAAHSMSSLLPLRPTSLSWYIHYPTSNASLIHYQPGC